MTRGTPLFDEQLRLVYAEIVDLASQLSCQLLCSPLCTDLLDPGGCAVLFKSPTQRRSKVPSEAQQSLVRFSYSARPPPLTELICSIWPQ